MRDQRKSILLLDNNNYVLGLADEMMYYGFSDMHITANCDAVYDIAKTHKPDLIILDFLKLDANASRICNTLKQDTTLSNVPVLLITDYTGYKTDWSLYTHDAHFVKTIDVEQLAIKINYLLAS